MELHHNYQLLRNGNNVRKRSRTLQGVSFRHSCFEKSGNVMKLYLPSIITIIMSLYNLTYAVQSDFLIITNPQELSILNQYEQPLSDTEKHFLLQFMPFLIVNQKEVLGDQITEAVKCNNLGNIYYLIKNDKGGFLSSNTVTFQKITRATVLNDTVEAARDFVLSQKFPSKGIETSIKKGDLFIRIFQNGVNAYLFRIGKPSLYGWCNNPDFLKQITKDEQLGKTADYSDIVPRIQKHFNNINDYYKSYFSFFNTLTNQQKGIPVWEMTSDNGTYKCTLKCSQSTLDQLEESTHYIFQDIKQLLLGKPFSVSCTKNQILILKR